MRRVLNAIRWWWMTSRPISAWVPGRSTLERMRRLNASMRWVKD